MTQPTNRELDNAVEVIQAEIDIIKNHFYPLPGISPSNLSQQNITDKFNKITENAYRLNEVAKWYLVGQAQNQAYNQRIDQLNNEKNTNQQLLINAQRQVNNLQTQLNATTTLLEQKERRLEQTNHDIKIERAKHGKWKNRTKTECAKHAKWKDRTKTERAKHAKWKNRTKTECANVTKRCPSINVISRELIRSF